MNGFRKTRRPELLWSYAIIAGLLTCSALYRLAYYEDVVPRRMFSRRPLAKQPASLIPREVPVYVPPKQARHDDIAYFSPDESRESNFEGSCPENECAFVRETLESVESVSLSSPRRLPLGCVHFRPGRRFCTSLPFATESDSNPGVKAYKQRMEIFLKDVASVLPENATGFATYRPTDSTDETPDADVDALWNAEAPFLAHNMLAERSGKKIWIPDPHFIGSRGFEHIRVLDEIHVPYKDRLPTVFWRGSSNSANCSLPSDYVHLDDATIWSICDRLPRVRMARKCVRADYLDVRISRARLCCGKYQEELKIEGIIGDVTPEKDWIHYRGMVEVDGVVNAWGNTWRSLSGSVIFKVDSPYTNFYTANQRPWVHYIPVKDDYSDLVETTKLIVSNTADVVDAMTIIGLNSQKLAKSMTYTSEVERVGSELLAFWRSN